MCVAAIALGLNQTYPFILLHNRDESYGRASAPLETDSAGIAGGRDLVAGGRWLGVVHQGDRLRFAFVTNHRQGPRSEPGKRSRGLLVNEFLKGALPAEDFIATLPQRSEEYSPFNFVAGDFESFGYLNSVSKASALVEQGLFALSNGDPRELWPKSRRLQEGLRVLASSALDEKRLVQNFFLLLADTQKAPMAQLPQTGVPPEWEEKLSPIFIETPHYGTRASTLILREASGTIKIWEREFIPHRRPTTRQLLL